MELSHPWNFRSTVQRLCKQFSFPGTFTPVTEPVVPALDNTVGPDGRLECRPTAGWPQPATHPRFVNVSDKDDGDGRRRCLAWHQTVECRLLVI